MIRLVHYGLLLACLWQGGGEALAAGREVTILTGSIPPYTYLEEGHPRGVAVELIQAVAGIVGHSGKMQFLPWKRAVKMAEDGLQQPYLVLPLNRSPEREALFTWIAPLLSDETALITRKTAKPHIDTYNQALGYNVGVLLGSPLETELRAKKFSHVDPGVDEETNARKLQAGRIDVWFVAAMVAPFVFKRLGFNPAELDYGPSLQVNDLHLAASKSLPAAEVERWRSALDQIRKNGVYDSIVRKYRNVAGP